jgi:TatD DNase family protein
LDLALKYDLPIIMHLRNKNGGENGYNAYKDALEMLDNLPQMPRGVVHFFQGNLEEAQEFLKRGLLLGFDGYITFDSHYDDIIKAIPLDKILIETDSPYVAPVPFRGKRNEPKFVEYVAEKVAEVKGISIEEIKRVTCENARALFNVNEDVNEVELR